jgi:hypothetical protein
LRVLLYGPLLWNFIVNRKNQVQPQSSVMRFPGARSKLTIEGIPLSNMVSEPAPLPMAPTSLPQSLNSIPGDRRTIEPSIRTPAMPWTMEPDQIETLSPPSASNSSPLPHCVCATTTAALCETIGEEGEENARSGSHDPL